MIPQLNLNPMIFFTQQYLVEQHYTIAQGMILSITKKKKKEKKERGEKDEKKKKKH